MDGKVTKTSRIVDAGLAAFLLVLILTFGILTIAHNAKDLYNSVRIKSRLSGYLPSDPGALDFLSARIQSFEAAFGDDLWKKNALGQANADLQYIMGKNIITTGSANMVKLPTGDLYDLQTPADITDALDEIIRFASAIDVPFTYIYEHATTYGDDKLTGGYAQLDWGDELGDQIVSTLRGANLDVIDSRVALEGFPTSEIVLRTDQHWTPYAALNVAHVLAKEIGLDDSLLDPAAFYSQTFPDKYLGKYGRRVGVKHTRPDDFTIFWPKYDTEISRYTNQNSNITEVTGPFGDSVIKWSNLNGEGWNSTAYRAYGLTENFEHFHNEAAPDVTILVFKDSYGAPVGAFLSLVARDVYLVDMRKTDRDATEFVDELKPDRVVMSYSRQMVVLHGYRLFHDQ